MSSLSNQVREILAQGQWLKRDLETLRDDADLYDAGLSSHDSVNLMLALEEAFDVEFPDALLKRRTFESIQAISSALSQLKIDAPVP
ncbi:Acyl carrier protein [Arboricoccus pini]|uniref:Acyl carrier protein n=1 Tax=Arboricoccus pini TaxID=1963835 RepID=A0A212RIN6_9PROT|nr:Acyl carrier protein [Arboricoccus pini]